ncbi:MAG: orotate phosphoribosyltransferase [Planctomycetota bacterium]|jgi:orotate phosphoribosyltransferase
MDGERVLELLRNSEALLEGHFELSSGKHSDRYFQCAKVLQYPEYAQELACGLKADLEALSEPIQVVVGPAMGAVVWSYAVAQELGVRSLFTERKDGGMVLRRGFSLEPGERILVVEDALTTGGSAREAIKALEAAGGHVVAVGSVVNRSGGNPFEQAGNGLKEALPLFALCNVKAETWEASECPLCKAGGQAIKPGSRPGVSANV